MKKMKILENVLKQYLGENYVNKYIQYPADKYTNVRVHKGSINRSGVPDPPHPTPPPSPPSLSWIPLTYYESQKIMKLLTKKYFYDYSNKLKENINYMMFKKTVVYVFSSEHQFKRMPCPIHNRTL